MNAYLRKLLRGKYVNSNLILAIDIITSTFASWVAIISISALMNYYVMPRMEILCYTGVALTASIVFLFLSKTHQSIIRHMKLRSIARFVGAILGKNFVLTIYLVCFSSCNIQQLTGCIIADFFLTLFLLLGMRVAMQIVYDYIRSNSSERHSSARVLVYGTGDKAASLVTRLQNSPHYRIVGFLTYSESRHHMSIADQPVFSFRNIHDITALIDKIHFDTVIFAHRAEARIEENRLIKFCKQQQINILYAPSIDDFSSSNDKLKVREINIEDLLERPTIELSMRDIITNFKDKTVLVTGAAGSIGSELCRQLAFMGVKRLVMFDSAETPMHELRLEFDEKFPDLEKVPVIGDVRNKKRLDFVMRTHHPQVVFHAAAYKHVPLMEENPCEAVHANVIGSRNVADKCLEYDVDMMVMISTDKAVNPTNVMGCSKRIAEIYVQSLGLAVEKGKLKGKTRFVTTRFGNVLGSNGSVIPRFKEQIEKGGPVTVTHPEINRYFMTIPEACKLVMEAATISIGNQIFVFDMGKSVKIAHLAERMIQLAGFTPNVDIKIEYTGLRPGEKLFEEVLSNEENTLPTGHNRIRIAKVRESDYDEAKDQVNTLEVLAKGVDIPSMIKLMKQMVPEFKSNNSPYEKYDKAEQITLES